MVAEKKGCRGAVAACGARGWWASGPWQGKPQDKLAVAAVRAVCFACAFWLLCAFFFGAPSQHLPRGPQLAGRQLQDEASNCPRCQTLVLAGKEIAQAPFILGLIWGDFGEQAAGPLTRQAPGSSPDKSSIRTAL